MKQNEEKEILEKFAEGMATKDERIHTSLYPNPHKLDLVVNNVYIV